MEEEFGEFESGPFKGKKIKFASSTGVDMLIDISEDLMKRIFGFDSGEYLITDESSLQDFTGVDDMELLDIQTKIREVYDLDVSDIEPGNLVEIFMRIHRNKYGEPS
ncbi:hypothetical protein IIA15_03175 [candidate division TA06 bacterium]|nr:hypothetical protein [candidate division TA06 bacterium]